MHCPGLICPLGCPRTHRASVEEPGYRAAGSCSLSGLRLRGWAHKVPTILDHLRFPRAVPPRSPSKTGPAVYADFHRNRCTLSLWRPLLEVGVNVHFQTGRSWTQPRRTRTAGGQVVCTPQRAGAAVQSSECRSRGSALSAPAQPVTMEEPVATFSSALPSCQPAKLRARQAAGQPGCGPAKPCQLHGLWEAMGSPLPWGGEGGRGRPEGADV